MMLSSVRSARLCLLWATVMPSAPVLACTAANAMQHELWGDRGIAQEPIAAVGANGVPFHRLLAKRSHTRPHPPVDARTDLHP
jgi:hypothetical protein